MTSQTHSIFKATRSSGYETQWQREKRRGKIEAMPGPTMLDRFKRVMGR